MRAQRTHVQTCLVTPHHKSLLSKANPALYLFCGQICLRQTRRSKPWASEPLHRGLTKTNEISPPWDMFCYEEIRMGIDPRHIRRVFFSPKYLHLQPQQRWQVYQSWPKSWIRNFQKKTVLKTNPLMHSLFCLINSAGLFCSFSLFLMLLQGTTENTAFANSHSSDLVCSNKINSKTPGRKQTSRNPEGTEIQSTTVQFSFQVVVFFSLKGTHTLPKDWIQEVHACF